MSYPKYANTGKYNWLLGNMSMAKRSGLVISQNNNQTCPTCVCCSKTQVDLYNAKAMLLCCMDFRLRDNMICQLNLKGYQNKYDEVITAGASLGYNGLLSYTNWDTFVDEHVKLAYDLHNISQIIIIDHEKCGAFTAQYGSLTLEQEYVKHVENITTSANTLWNKFNSINGTVQTIPGLVIIGYLISIDGCNLTEIYRKS